MLNASFLKRRPWKCQVVRERKTLMSKGGCAAQKRRMLRSQRVATKIWI